MVDIDQRMFYLMLSATEGQKFASSMGFPTPSEDVQELEIMDVLSRWMMVHTSGMLDEIREAADWFVSFLEETDKINSPSEDFVNALIVFAIALNNKMLDNGHIGLILSDEDLEVLEGLENE
jgi:hypothetical protein